jgi:SAM-dependent methyltransferase
MSPSTILTRAFQRVRRVVNSRLVKRWGDHRTKQAIWDQEFQAGEWTQLDSTADDPVYIYLERYIRGGNILDLGCGAGNTGDELNERWYSEYTGVDVSQVATDLAAARSSRNGRDKKSQYLCGDIAAFVPSGLYQVILFRESIYYIPRSKIVDVLLRYRKHLKQDGVFIVRMFSRHKYKPIVRLIERNFELIESAPQSGPDIILVFR